MSSIRFPILLRLQYEKAAEEYLRSLPPEHFMEATAQGTQREITLESLALVKARRPEVQVFNELLVQYPRPRAKKPEQVVPDNMIVLHSEPLHAKGSYDIPLQPARPFCMLEYVSKSSERKDYDDNMQKYERELKVPYYLLFYPDNQELTLYHHNKRKYVSVKPNAENRVAIPEMELEMALLDGWVRFWYQGQLLPLPAELLRKLDEIQRRLTEVQGQLDATQDQLDATQGQLDATQNRLDATQDQLDATQNRLDQEHQARLAVEEELMRLRAQVAQQKGTSNQDS